MNTLSDTRYVAALDLGSNSFHMVVAQIVENDLQLVSRHKQRVRLANGLDENKKLDEASIQRGLDCLSMFAERIQGFEEHNVRIAATHTLRQALNSAEFLERAKMVIPYPIEIIPGLEEARLVYLGVAHTQPQTDSMLVIDIGGGSTEFIIGHQFESELVNSIQMGCVSLTNRFFDHGNISKKRFQQACVAAEQKLEPIASQYKKRGWKTCFGSSGTVKAIREVLIGLGFEDGIITMERLLPLVELIQNTSSVDELTLKSLSDERKPVFVAGVAILIACIKALKIKEIHFSDGALREGLLYEMEDAFKYSDIRIRTTENMAKKHLVDLEHATQVMLVAKDLFRTVEASLGLGKKSKQLEDLLDWASLLHEVGLSISLQGYHKHSSYILRYSNMPGFNTEQQQVLSVLTRFQRKNIKLNEIPELILFKKKHIIQLIRILRLAIVLNAQRNDEAGPKITLTIDSDNSDTWHIHIDDEHGFDTNKLLYEDLVMECQYWSKAGWTLTFSPDSPKD